MANSDHRPDQPSAGQSTPASTEPELNPHGPNQPGPNQPDLNQPDLNQPGLNEPDHQHPGPALQEPTLRGPVEGDRQAAESPAAAPSRDATPRTPARAAQSTLDPYDEPDEIAPVDWQADPAHWLPGRALPIAAGIVLLITVATIVICLIIWLTPPMEPLKIPVVGKA